MFPYNGKGIKMAEQKRSGQSKKRYIMDHDLDKYKSISPKKESLVKVNGV